MKFKVAVIAILVAILGVTTAGTVLVVQEAREQTQIALKTAEIASIQADIIAYQSITQVGSDEWNAYTSMSPNEEDLNTYILGEFAAQNSNSIQKIRESLGLDRLDHPVYFFDEEYQIPNIESN